MRFNDESVCLSHVCALKDTAARLGADVLSV